MNKIENNFLYRVLDGLSNAVAVTDFSDRYIYFNSFYAELVDKYFGHKFSVDSTIDSIAGAFPEQLDRIKTGILRAIKGEENSIVHEMKKPVHGHFELVLKPFYDENGSISGVLHFIKDITELTKTGEAVTQSDLRFRNLIENSPVPILLVSNNIILYANAAYVSLFGYNDLKDVAGDEFDKYVQTENFKTKIAELYDSTSVELEFETVGKTKLGEEINLQIRLKQVNLPDKKSLLVFINNITELKKIEESLKEKEEHYRSLFYNSGSLAIFLDKNLKIISINDEAEKLFGHKVPPTGELDFTKNLIPQFSEEFIKQKLKAILEGRSLNNVGSTISTKYYGKRYIVWNLNRIVDNNNNPTGIIVVGQDFTLQKESEAKVIKLNRLYSILNQIDKAIVRITETEKLLQEVCRVAVEKGNFNFAWFGLADEITSAIIPICFAGDTPPPVRKLPMTFSDEKNKSLFARAIEEQKVKYSNDIKLEKGGQISEQFPYNSGVSIPIIVNSKVIGVFNFYSLEKDLIDEIELDLLQEIGDNVSFAISKIEEVNQRKIANRALKESEERFRVLYENAPIAYISMDENDCIVDVNTTWLLIFGYTKAEVIGMSFTHFLTEADKDSFKESFELYKILGVINDLEYTLVKKDGREVTCSFNGKISIDAEGKFQKLHCIVIDITERKQYEEKMKLHSHIFHNVRDAIVASSLDDTITSCNSATEDLFGFTMKEIIGKNVFDFVKNGYVNLDTEKVVPLLDGTGSWKGEVEIFKKTGERRVCETTMSNLYDTQGLQIGTIIMFHDVTDRLQMVDELIAAKNKAEEMNRVKTNFLSNMSHELRTPMVGILSFADLLTRNLQDEEDRDMAKIILKSGNRLMNTLNLILNLSKIEANQESVTLSPVNVSYIIKETVKLFSAAASSKNLKLSVELSDDVLPSMLDERLLTDILNNLLNNAVKFTNTGGITLEAEKIIVDLKPFVIIKVTDTGIGIPAENIDMIFEEFRQVSEGIGRSFEGTGLGLTLTKKLVYLLKGEIFINSKVGEGTTFILKFSYLEGAVMPNQEILENSKTEDRKLQFNNKSIPSEQKSYILQVEDDTTTRVITSLLLKNICRIDFASNGETAINMIEQKKYELILLDVNLGQGMSGIETVREIRKNPDYKDIPIIALTAFAMKSDMEECLAAGFSYYLSKPFNNEELYELVERLVIK